jgi:CRP-like cAMP-binding protein
LKADLIKNVPLFADLTADEHQALADCMRLESYQAGEQVFVEGARSDAFFLVQEGWVKLSQEGGRLAIATLGPGSLLGETDFFLGQTRGTSAQASTPLSLWVFNEEDFREVFREHGEIGLKLGLSLGSGIVQYRQFLLERVGHISFLRDLDEERRQAVADQLTPQRYRTNEAIFRSGDSASGLYLIESGSVRLIGDEGEYGELGPGATLGELAVLAGKPHPDTAQAVSQTIIWHLSPTDFTRLADTYPQLRAALGRRLRSSLSAADRVQAVEVLKRMPLFADLDREELDSVASCLLLRHVQAGDEVYVSGNAGDAMYFIESGQVEILSDHDEERRQTLARLIPGDFFGEMALLTGKSRTVAARAVVHSNLWVLYRSDFDGLLVKHPALTVALSRALRDRLSQAEGRFVAAHLHTIAVTGDLSRIQLDALAERLTPQTVQRGDVVYYEGRAGDTMYFIESGRVELVASAPRGPVLLETLETGGFFGEMALLTGKPHIATARVLAGGTLWALRKQDFDELLFKYPNMAVVLSRVLSERQVDAVGKMRGGKPRARVRPTAAAGAMPGKPAARPRPAPKKKAPTTGKALPPAKTKGPVSPQPKRRPSPLAKTAAVAAGLARASRPVRRATRTGPARPIRRPPKPIPPSRAGAEPRPTAAETARPRPDQPVKPAVDPEVSPVAVPQAVVPSEPTKAKPSEPTPGPQETSTAIQERPPAQLSAAEGIGRGTQLILRQTEGVVGELAVWFTTRSRRVKMGLLMLLMLLIWLCGITAPSALINQLSANLNGGENDIGYAYAQDGSEPSRLSMQGVQENGAVAALPFVETVTPTRSNTPTPTDTPTVTPTTTGTPLPTWTPTATPTDTPLPSTATPTPLPDTPTPTRPPYTAAPRPPADTPTPEPTPTPDVDFIIASVRQLTPCENEGNHHIYIHVIDQAGNGINDVPVKVCWGGNDNDCARPFTETKQRGKGWIEFAMFKGTYNVRVDGAKSAVASGITPDFQVNELCPASGNAVANSLYHASFEVTIQKVR